MAAQGPAAPKPGLSRSSSVESSSAGIAAASRHRPPPGWPAPPARGDPGGSPVSSVGSGPLPPPVALEQPARADAGARGAVHGDDPERRTAEQPITHGPAPWANLSAHAGVPAPAPLQGLQQQPQHQQQQQQRTLDPQVPPPPTHRKPSGFSQWAPAFGGMRQDATLANPPLGGMPAFPARFEFASPQQVLQSGTVQLGTPLPLSGSGRAVLADPIGRSMLGSLRLAVQTGRVTAEDAANQLASYLRGREISSPAVGPAHGFGAPGSTGSYGEASYGSYGQWDGNGQMQQMTSGPAGAAGDSAGWPQWHAAAGAAGQQTASAESQSQPHGAKRAGRRPLYARGSSNGSDNGHEQSQDREYGVSASNGNVAGAFAGLSLHANSFQPRMQLGGLGEPI